jgi:hypothetical protein
VLRRDGGSWRIPNLRSAWPSVVDVSLFQFHDEIAKLIVP